MLPDETHATERGAGMPQALAEAPRPHLCVKVVYALSARGASPCSAAPFTLGVRLGLAGLV